MTHRTPVRRAGMVGSLMVAGALAQAATQYLGDANTDGALDAGDVRTVRDTLEDPASATPQERTFSDANDDGQNTAADEIYLQGILLGANKALPAAMPIADFRVSFWKPEPPPAPGTLPADGTIVMIDRVSFYKPEPAPDPGTLPADGTVVMTQRVSIYKPDDVIPAATDVDARLQFAVSFNKPQP